MIRKAEMKDYLDIARLSGVLGYPISEVAVKKNLARILKDADGQYKPLFCRHCDDPECVKSCMSGALTKDPETGHVCYDEEKCGSCFMCVMNCPYGVLKADTATRTKVIKCDFCENDGGEPNCVKSCPKKAIYVEEVNVLSM